MLYTYKYLKFVGYNSGVHKNIVLNDPVIPNFPMKLNTTDAFSKLLFLPRQKKIKLIGLLHIIRNIIGKFKYNSNLNQ